MRRGAFLLTLLVTALLAAGGAREHGTASAAESIRLSGLPKLGLVTRATLDWCGTGQPTALDRKPDVELSSTRQVHVTYAIPADALDQFSTLAPRIATDAAALDAWWRGQDATRTIRFDLYAFAGCTTKYGKLDIGFVRLPRVGNLYLGDAGADRLLTDLSQLDALSTQKHLVYYDGPDPFDSFVCGTTFVTRNAPTQGGLDGVAFVWLKSLCGGDVGAGGLNAAVAVHELIHGLGALVQGGAPNECAPPDDGHVCDATNDILYPEASSQTTLATQRLDVNHDDYYGHSGAWFDVQDSLWLTHLPQLTLTIGVQSTGKAGGTVRMTSPSAFECAQTCPVELDSGTAASLAAAAKTGSRFVGWRGGCSGTGACNVTLDAAKSVTAMFAAVLARLTVSVSGKGKVTSTPAGLSCPRRCTATFPAGTVRLKATPAAGYRFAGWSGSCRGTGACVLKADHNRSARATFRKKG